MATKIHKAPWKIWPNRKVKFFNNSVIFKVIELKFGIEANFTPLNSKRNIKLEFVIIHHGDIFCLLGLFIDKNSNMMSFRHQTSKFLKF